MRWTETYATGVARIDEQHKMLFRMSEDFREALTEGRGERVYANLLESLDLYARSHFTLEERCMAACRCPAGDRNSHAHGQFIGMLRDFGDRHAGVGYRAGDAQELVDFLDQWLSSHIAGIDTQLLGSAPDLPSDWHMRPGSVA
jgi:hemerythrin